MVLNLTKRQAMLGGKLNPRVEYHGDEQVPACDFTLTGIMLDADELNALLDTDAAIVDHHAYDRLFVAGDLPEPAFRDISLAVPTKFEKSSITLKLGNLAEDVLKFGGAKIAKIVLSPQTGGLTALSLQVQANPEAPQLASLYVHMGKDVSATIRFGKEQVKATKDQPELPLSHQSPASDANAEQTEA